MYIISKVKLQPFLIKSFLETAISKKFIRNHYHNALFRWHILVDNQIQNPGMPQYYPKSMFWIIKDVHFNTDLNIVKMTSSEWYQVLLEKNMTMILNNEDGTSHPRLSKIELRKPWVNWDRTWTMMSFDILSPDLRSFLIKTI